MSGTRIPTAAKSKTKARPHHVYNVLSIVHSVWYLIVIVRKYFIFSVLSIFFFRNQKVVCEKVVRP